MTKEEFEKAVREHRRYILKFVRKKVAEDDVEDIVQQVLKELADSKAYLRFRGDSSVKTWLVGAVRKRVLDWYRKRDRSRKKEKEIVDRLKLEQKLDDPYQSPEDELIQIEKNELKQARFKEAEQRLEHLPPDMQDAFWQYGKGTSWAKIAKEQGIKVKTLQSRVRRYGERIRREEQSREKKAGKKVMAPVRKTEAVPVMVIEEHLWHPDNLRIAKHLRQGGLLRSALQPSDYKTNVQMWWAPGVEQRINSALKRGDIEKLAQLLQNQPYAIAHPVVFRQIAHLSELLRMTGAEVLPVLYEIGASIDPDEPILPAGAKQAAREALQRLLSVWVGRMLPGHTVERVKSPKRRGRKRKMSEWEAEDSLMEFNDLYDELKKYPSTSFRRKDGETQESLIARTAELVQELHMKSQYSHESYVDPNHPKYDPSDIWNLFATFTKQKPLPPEVAMQVARRAVPKRDVRKHDLVYGLLAHHWNWSFDRVRRLVERAELEFPELARRR